MKRVLLCAVLLSLSLPVVVHAGAESHPSHPSAGSAAAASDRDGWPDTRVGELARGWVTAFSSGDSAMKVYLAAHMATASLADKNVPQRIERYRDLREKYGRLELASVVKSTDEKLTVKLMGSDATRTEFIFTAQTEAPWKLVSVAIREAGHFGHGGFGH